MIKQRKFTLPLSFLVTCGMVTRGGFKSDQPGFKVILPAGTETWYPGKSYIIQWSRSGLIPARVKIELYDFTGNIKVADIASETSNGGIFSWTVPSGTVPGNYIIKVTTLDNKFSDKSNLFRIRTDSEKDPLKTSRYPVSAHFFLNQTGT